MTAVIVRSSTNVAAGGKTRMASVVHGGFLILSILVLSSLLNLIPLSALSAILLMVGYKLTQPALYKMQYKLGRAQFVRSEEHTSELQSLMRISYAVFCLKKKNTTQSNTSQ